ncbi:unnamed protein product [Ectocarpus sp. CCAP 1310/34]|nr:unnamed protein product [Ectocarpus sp. CCAP 1310/34]
MHRRRVRERTLVQHIPHIIQTRSMLPKGASMESCSSLYTCPDTTRNCFDMESRTAICTCASEGFNAW